MRHKTLIIHLIRQDLKHSQLTDTLKGMGLEDGGLYALDLMALVAQLMKVPASQLEQFTTTYGQFLDRAPQLPISFSGQELTPVAEACYKQLKGCLG